VQSKETEQDTPVYVDLQKELKKYDIPDAVSKITSDNELSIKEGIEKLRALLIAAREVEGKKVDEHKKKAGEIKKIKTLLLGYRGGDEEVKEIKNIDSMQNIDEKLRKFKELLEEKRNRY